MQALRAIFLGLVQGFSEFFPISSSGNLFFYSSLFDIKAYTLSFDILLHTACLIVLIWLYHKDIAFMYRNPRSNFNKLVGIGILPITIVSVILQWKIDDFFYTSKVMGFCFVLTGVLIFIATKYRPGKKRFKNMKPKDAAVIGGLHVLGTIPGISRNAMVICGGLERGFDGRTSLKYAYIMSIPAIFGRILFDLIRLFKSTGETVTDVFGGFSMLLGFVASGFAAFVAIRLMQKLVQKGNLRGFAYYLWVVGGIMIIDMLFVNKIFI